MTHYAVTLNGRILRTFSLDDETALPERESGAIVCGALVNSSTHYERNGEIHPIPAQPGDSWVFSHAKGTWEYSQNVAWELIRRKRNQLIAATDWRILPDAPTTPEMRALLIEYRQALRDVTDQVHPEEIVWPTSPLG